MITILKTTRCFWRNRFSPRPVLAVQLALDESLDRAPSPLEVILLERWPGLRVELGDAELVAAIAQQLQLIADVTEPDCGTSKRDADQTKPTIFFACRDHVSAEIAIQMAVDIVNQMRSGLNADQLRKLLDESIEAAEGAGFDAAMRELLKEADRRDIPWVRAKATGWNALIGHGVKRKLIKSADGVECDRLAPLGETLRIPTAMITGTKGKTTTSLMLEYILTAAGHVVGAANTIGVTAARNEIAHGDLAGVPGALLALRDANVTAAVLETARGGIVKWGIYPDSCDIAALLNVSAEQIGIDGIDTVEQMAALKRKVLEGARDAVVLNAEDAFCVAMIQDFRRSLRAILFSMNEQAPALQEHLNAGGDAVVLHRSGDAEYIAIAHGAERGLVVDALAIPAVMSGLIRVNIANALAATALACAMKIETDCIRAGLSRFANSADITRGRFNFIDEFPVKIMLDRAGPVAALRAFVDVADRVSVQGKRWLLCSSVGNRPNRHFTETMAVIAGHFDRYIPYGLEKWRRGRAPGEIQRLSADALIAAGVSPGAVSTTEDFPEAAHMIAREATADDFVFVIESDNDVVMDELRAAFAEARGEQHA